MVDLEVPLILVALTQAIIDLEGARKEGLFRVSGNKRQMDTIKTSLTRGDYNIAFTSPHNIAGLLKEWLKSLPSPLIPQDAYFKCMEAQTPQDCLRIIEELPNINKKVLIYLMEFIVNYVLTPEAQKMTRMDVQGIGMAFAACLMVSPSLDIATMMKEIQAQIRFVSNLLIALKPQLGSKGRTETK